MEEVNVKDCFSKFRPEGCVFVISIDSDDKPSGMIAGWKMKCSEDPPLFAVSLSKEGYTHKLIRESREFVIAVPNNELEGDVRFFGENHGDEVDKFKETGIEIEKAKFVRSPLIKNASINIECKLIKEVDSGDHIIFIGEILACYINDGKKILFNLGKKEDRWVFGEVDRVE